MRFAFVDYENIGTLEKVAVTGYGRLIVFCGQNQNTLTFGDMPAGEGTQIQVVKIPDQSKNNLDFHMALELGRFHERESAEIVFHVITNDSDLDNLLKHLQALGRKCERIKIPKTVKPGAETKPTTVAAHHCPAFSKVVNGLTSLAEKKRPAGKDKLLNWIESQTRMVTPVVKPGSVYERLVAGKKVREDGNKISYTLKG